MKVYTVLIKKVDDEDRTAPFWEDKTYLIIAPNFAIAEDKAQRVLQKSCYIKSISFYGDMLERDHDVIKIKDR